MLYRDQKRAEKQRQWRHANRLWHEDKEGNSVLTNRKGRINERKIDRWHRRRNKVMPALREGVK